MPGRLTLQCKEPHCGRARRSDGPGLLQEASEVANLRGAYSRTVKDERVTHEKRKENLARGFCVPNRRNGDPGGELIKDVTS